MIELPEFIKAIKDYRV